MSGFHARLPLVRQREDYSDGAGDAGLICGARRQDATCHAAHLAPPVRERERYSCAEAFQKSLSLHKQKSTSEIEKTNQRTPHRLALWSMNRPPSQSLLVDQSLMRQLRLLVLLGLLLAGAAQAQSNFWRDKDGNPATETDSMKAKDGFGGLLLATTDADWEQKWETPPETVPQFQAAGIVPYGKKVYILSFFANPAKDDSGKVTVRCDLKIVDPNGRVTHSFEDQPCFSGRLAGKASYVYLSTRVVAFSGDPGDPAGTWLVEMTLRDTIRNTELPLRTRFQLR